MKRILSILIAAIAVLATAPVASADQAMMQELAKLMSESSTDGTKVIYDGKNLVFVFPPDFLTAEEAEALSALDDNQLASMLLQELKQSMGQEEIGIIAQLLKANNTGLGFRLNLQGKTKDFVIKAEDF